MKEKLKDYLVIGCAMICIIVSLVVICSEWRSSYLGYHDSLYTKTADSCNSVPEKDKEND